MSAGHLYTGLIRLRQLSISLMNKKLVVHPFLLAIFPILALYANNIEELSFSITLLPLAISLGFTLLLFLMALFIIRDSRKAGLILSTLLILFFSYGHILGWIKGLGLGNAYIGDTAVGTPARYLLFIWVAAFIGVTYLVLKTSRNLAPGTNVMNLIAATLVIIPTISIGIFEFQRPGLDQQEEIPAISLNSEDLDCPPDIYYIVLDAYASNSTLKEFYNFDNMEFTNYLFDRGFYVAPDSTCNHTGSHYSIASSLNMEYMNYLNEEANSETSTTVLAYELLQNHRVGQILQSIGYKYTHIGSQWTMTATNRYADVNFSPLPISEFAMMLCDTTIIPIIPGISDRLGVGDSRRMHWEYALYQFEKLLEIPNTKHDNKEPVFVFAHVVIPHIPHVFNRDGTFLTKEEESTRTTSDNYLNQLIACNNLIIEFVDNLLSNYSESTVSPIIILQGDHGPWGLALSEWESSTEEDKIKISQRMLNAYCLPNGGNALLYKNITPVNTFRLIFNYYFGTNYELLNDRMYRGISTDVTNIFSE